MAQGFTSPVISPQPNSAVFSVLKFTVVTSGTPVQLSNTVVPDGFEVLIVADKNQNGTMFVANSSANTADATKRFELKKGDSLSLRINNLDLVWIDSTNNNRSIFVVFEG